MRIKAICSYKGTRFYGYQKQVKKLTVQGEIERALSTYFNDEIHIYSSGRTDAGVHALNQVFHFDVFKEVDLDKLRYSLNKMLPYDIHIKSLEIVDENFHSRFSLKDKTYIYKIAFKEKSPFEDDLIYVCPFPTDKEVFKKNMMKFIGEHDFKDFTSKEEDEGLFVRNVFNIDIKEEGDNLELKITGNGFMRYMIRMMIGCALAVAQGKERDDYIDYHLSKKDEREIVSYKASASGLYLESVKYSD